MGPEDGEARVQHVPHPQLLLAQVQHPGHRGVVSAQGEDGPSYPSYLVSCSLSGSAGIRSLSAASSFLLSSSTR